jgi:hypothetical protein
VQQINQLQLPCAARMSPHQLLLLPPSCVRCCTAPLQLQGTVVQCQRCSTSQLLQPFAPYVAAASAALHLLWVADFRAVQHMLPASSSRALLHTEEHLLLSLHCRSHILLQLLLLPQRNSTAAAAAVWPPGTQQQDTNAATPQTQTQQPQPQPRATARTVHSNVPKLIATCDSTTMSLIGQCNCALS